MQTRDYSSSTFSRPFYLINHTSSSLSRHTSKYTYIGTPEDVSPFQLAIAPGFQVNHIPMGNLAI